MATESNSIGRFESTQPTTPTDSSTCIELYVAGQGWIAMARIVRGGVKDTTLGRYAGDASSTPASGQC